MKIWFKFFFAAVLVNTALFTNTTDYDSDNTFHVMRNTDNSVNTTTIETATKNVATSEAEIISDSSTTISDSSTTETNIILSTNDFPTTAETTDSEFVDTITNPVQIISNSSTTIFDSSTTETNIILSTNDFPTTAETTDSEFVDTITNPVQIISNSSTTIPESLTTEINELATNLDFPENDKDTTNYEITTTLNNLEAYEEDETIMNTDETLITEDSSTSIDYLTTNNEFSTIDNAELITHSPVNKFKITVDKAETVINATINNKNQAPYPEKVTNKSSVGNELNNRTLNEAKEMLLNSATTYEIQATIPENTTSKTISNSSVIQELVTATEATNTATDKEMLQNNNFQATENVTKETKVSRTILNTTGSTENLENLNHSGTEHSLLKKQTGVDSEEPEITKYLSAPTKPTVSFSDDGEEGGDAPPTTTVPPDKPAEPPSCTSELNKVKNLTVTPSSFFLYITWIDPIPECKFQYDIEWDTGKSYSKTTEYYIMDLDPCDYQKISVSLRYLDIVLNPKTTEGKTTDTMWPVEYLEYKEIDDHTLKLHWGLPDLVKPCFKKYNFKKYEDGKATTNIDYYETSITVNEVNGCINNTYEVIALSETESASKSISYFNPELNDPPVFNEKTTEIGDDFVITKWNFGKIVCRPERFYVLCNKENEKPPFCVEGEFRVEGELDIHRNELTAKLDNVEPYTHYTCCGIIVNIEGESKCSEPGKFLTKSKPPEAPEKLNIEERDNTYLYINWQPPKNWNGVQKEYNISIEYLGLNYDLPKYCESSSFEQVIDTIDASETEYNFSTIIPAAKYKISVKAKSDGGWGEEIEENFDLEEGIPNKTEEIKINVISTSVNLTWKTPCKINGVLKYYNIKLIGKKDNNKPDIKEENYTPDSDESDIHTAVIENLLPSYTYLLQLRATNEKHIGKVAETNFVAPSGPPEEPRDITITENAQYLNIQWKPPITWNGNEKYYKVSVEFLGLNYNLSENCESETIDGPYSKILDAPKTELNFSAFIIPASKYRISVQAMSDGGWSKETEVLYDLAESKPEEPLIISSNLSSEEQNYKSSLNVSWRAPCKMHGVLQGFYVKLSGERFNFTSEDKEENVIRGDQEIYFREFPDLMPDFKYTINIQARNTYFGESVLQTWQTPAGIPDKPNVENLKKPNATAVSNPWESAIVYLRRDMFDETMGTILYYAVIVATEFCPEKPKYEIYDVNKWPTVTSDNSSCTNLSKAYEATEEKWNPFLGKSSDEFSYTLGEKNCSILDYCNRFLQPDTAYLIKIRGFTKNGFSDTRLLSLHTEARPLDAVPVALIVGLIVGILAIAFIIAAVLFYTKGKLNIKNWPRMESANQISPAPLPVPIKKFGAHYEKMIENPGKIKNEFQLLSTISSDVTLSTKTALLPVNKKKNRYINILPYDQTRVKLQENANSSDYINASFIKGYSGSNEYIASQGPTEATCPAFWQMILEQNVKLIVMLTQFVESGKDKCYKYFPDLKEEYDLLNDIKIQCIDEEILNVYNKRVFKVIKGSTAKKVTHIQFNLWPDFGVPDEVHHMIDFCEIIKEIKLKKPSIIVMHCSAGVGRTGTLIAVDILLQTIRDKRKVDIFGTVLNLRKQRMTMVQSERQYEFLYKCVYYVINNNKTSILSSKHILNQITESNM